MKRNYKHSDYDKIVVFFDGECNFCNRWVRFIHHRDSRKLFKFSSLQAPAALRILESFNTAPNLDSILLVEGDKMYTRSTAVLRILYKLDGPVKWLYILILVPKFIRDRVYRLFSENRYHLFGKYDSCELPDEDLKAKFL